jgi:hypothetical protein
MNQQKIETGVLLPPDGKVSVAWAQEQLERVSVFSQELLAYGRGEVFTFLKTKLSPDGFKQTVQDLDYTVETADKYIQYFKLKPALEAIKEKYYVALSLSASEYIPENIEDALALCDIAVAKYGKLTAENLRKAAEAAGVLPKKLSDAAISTEASKKKALHKWLLDEYALSDDDIFLRSSIHTEGKLEFLETMIDAYEHLGDWFQVYSIIADPIKNSNNTKALRFLSSLNNASKSIQEYIKSEQQFYELEELKEKFENEIYPELNFEAEKDNL